MTVIPMICMCIYRHVATCIILLRKKPSGNQTKISRKKLRKVGTMQSVHTIIAAVFCYCTEFMKTLLLMEATLKAENEVRSSVQSGVLGVQCYWHKREPVLHPHRLQHTSYHVSDFTVCMYLCHVQELLERKAQLQAAIKHEAELIDQYKVGLLYLSINLAYM